MKRNLHLSRRTVLRGLGTSVALPLLEGMLPLRAFGAGEGGSKPPVRMAFLFAPNGKHMPDWTPRAEGPLGDLPPILQPLEPIKSEILALSGLALTTAGTSGGIGHPCTVGQFLTGILPKRTVKKDVRAGISVDQVAAQAIGDRTRFPSLELGCVPSKYSGDCGSGYSYVYTTHISWRTPPSPLPKEVDPRAVFDRLFGNQLKKEERASRSLRDREKRSILDFAAEDAKALSRRLGRGDQRKLDEYLYAVRQIERRIDGTKTRLNPESGVGHERPAGTPRDRDEHLRLMMDMIVLAFQTDSTRILTLMIGNSSDNRSFPQIGISEGHHNLSHHTGSRKKQAKLSRINRHYMTHLHYLLEKLRSVKEAEGTLLDNSMIVYGCAFGDGNSHDPGDLPILLAGKGGGAIKPGRHVQYEAGTPLANLYLSMLDRVGAPTDQLGDATARLDQLS